MGLLDGIGRLVDAHPVAVLGSAAAVGAYRAHPWRRAAGIGAVFGLPTRPWSKDSDISDMLLGDPNAVAKITRGAALKAIANSISPYNDASIPYNRSQSPSGSIVLGLYNNRIK